MNKDITLTPIHYRAAAAQRRRRAEDEAKVIPESRIVDLVDPDIRIKQADDKGDRQDQTMPQAIKKSCGRIRETIFGTRPSNEKYVRHHHLRVSSSA
ncbi:hypothetical protein [Leptolyngbya sp. Heron Island J]|uniref:hypothetical protein n=1 Tax=Leptolyngbya sp. Heron Island J TaxID=1385935 RepID=UPI001378BBD5|nr:hypothetical protein [Leptolyngbya sp. Heron Island J]